MTRHHITKLLFSLLNKFTQRGTFCKNPTKWVPPCDSYWLKCQKWEQEGDSDGVWEMTLTLWVRQTNRWSHLKHQAGASKSAPQALRNIPLVASFGGREERLQSADVSQRTPLHFMTCPEHIAWVLRT